MTVQLIEITEDVADRMQVLTTPTPSQVGDARMIIIDLLGSGPSWPLAVLVNHVCTAYEAPDGERLMVDLRDREELADDELRDEPAHVGARGGVEPAVGRPGRGRPPGSGGSHVGCGAARVPYLRRRAAARRVRVAAVGVARPALAAAGRPRTRRLPGRATALGG